MGGGQAQPGHLPGPHHAGNDPACHGHALEDLSVGLVHQPQRLRLPTGDSRWYGEWKLFWGPICEQVPFFIVSDRLAGFALFVSVSGGLIDDPCCCWFRFDACILRVAKRCQFHTAQQSFGLEIVSSSTCSPLHLIMTSVSFLFFSLFIFWALRNFDQFGCDFCCSNKRGKPIIIDPGLYSTNKSELWWVIKQRTLPTAFKLYTGFYPEPLFFLFFHSCCWINSPPFQSLLIMLSPVST